MTPSPPRGTVLPAEIGEVRMKTNSIHNEVPEKSIAQFSSTGARAVVETTDGKVFSFSMSRPKGARFEEEHAGFHPGMWLQGAGGDYRIQPSGESPFTELEKHLELLSRIDDAFRSFEASLDHELSVETRQKCARKVVPLLEDDAVRAVVEPMLMANPMRPEWDVTHGPTEGKAGEILRAMVSKWQLRVAT